MSVAAIDDWIYLRSYLAPFADLLAREDVTDIYVNRPGELWIETLGGAIERHDAPQLNPQTLARLARQVAALTSQGISREHPLLSASLPDGSRIQFIAPPATRGNLALAIRKHVVSDLSLDDYAASGAFAETRTGAAHDDRQELADLVAGGDLVGALRRAVTLRKNILVSGGTSTGKTTFLNALIREIPQGERLIFIEDTPELQIAHANAVGLIAARSAMGEAVVTADDLVGASLRMRPDRILLGELRGREALAFLRAINTGHPGSMTTIHADSTAGAIEQLALLVMQQETTLTRADILGYARSTIHVIVQMERQGGKRVVREMMLAE